MMAALLPKELCNLAAVSAVTALSLPALRHALSRRKALAHADHELESDPQLYEDEDGITTEESVKKFATTRPKVTAGIAVVIGLACSIATTAVLVSRRWEEPQSTLFVHVSRCLACYSWTLLCCQWATLLLKNGYRSRFRLTVWALLSALIQAAALGASEGPGALSALMGQDACAKVVAALYLGQLGLALAAVLAFASFPQRPDVFYQEKLVDQQHTLSLLQVLSFSWNRVVFDIARERKMEMEDLPLPDHATRSKILLARFLTSRGKGQLWWQLIKVFSYELLMQWIMTLVIAFLALFPQVVLYNFLERLERRQDYSATPEPALFIWVFGLLLSQLLQVAMGNRLKWITFSRLNIPVTSTLQALVFSKALKQYETAAPGQEDDVKDDAKSGQNGKKDAAGGDKGNKGNKKDGGGGGGGGRQSVINHMKLDSARVSMFCVNNNNFPMALFKLVLAGGYLTSLMGWRPVAAGLGCGALMMPVTALISRRYGNIHFSLMKYRDGKAHLLTEALEGMRQIKYSALEQHWEDRILKSREEELRQYWWLALWQCAVIFIVNLGPLFLASVAFTVYTVENGTDIRASVIFAALGLFDQLDEAIALLPLLQMYLVEAYTSAVRLQRFLRQCDKEPVSAPGDTVSFHKVTLAWPKAEDTEKRAEAVETAEEAESSHDVEAAGCQANYSVLRDISLDFPAGKLSVITGKTGAGKSLLLAAILGEVKLISGSIRVPTAPAESGKMPEFIPDDEWIVPTLMAFVSQSPWVEGGTIRENIVFGLPFCKARYQRVIGACALENDLGLFVHGDETEVGPRGVTLSGGQRWRVALARALYSRAGIMILDDVLSAVDAQVGRRILDQALTGSLSRGRTRILATHHADLVLPWSSLVVRLHDGKLEAVEECAEQGTEADVVHVVASVSADPGPADPCQGESGRDGQAVRTKKKASDEEREEGRVKGKVYWAYFRAGGGAPWWTLTCSVLLLAQLLGVARTWSLKELAQQASTAARSVPSPSSPSAEVVEDGSARGIFFWLLVYVLLGFGISLVQMFRILAVFYMGLLAARRLFQQMTHAILRAPLRWISTVPAGRILNRFTSDTFTVDRRLAPECVSLVRSFLVMSIIIGTSLSVSAWVIFFGFLLFVLYCRIAGEYIKTAREVKRINSIANSPIYDQFGSVLSGLSTIRAYGRTTFYMDRMLDLIDNSSKASWALQLSSRWMAFRMGMLGAVFVTVVATAVVLGRVTAALAGFSLTFALRYTGSLTGLLQNMTSVELGFNACERVLEYTEIGTESEDGKDAPAAWPALGRIEVDNLTVAYAKDLPDVLVGLNFTIEAGERLGIVGRTGAGKSTLSSVLFRLLEAREGAVHIDGIDIATLKLSHLRSRLAIIPQDPFLFSGTLRSNLDMEGVLEDYELYQALRRVHLVRGGGEEEEEEEEDETSVGASASHGIFDNLSMPISTGGANLSQGQRQLVCLARALLARPKIVVLDEATSAVDKATDALIQRSIRDAFTAQGCTVLVIAHRLSTVADFDRILVLDKGRVAEMGSPRALVEKGLGRAGPEMGGSEDGPLDGEASFYRLVQKSAERQKLMEMIMGSA